MLGIQQKEVNASVYSSEWWVVRNIFVEKTLVKYIKMACKKASHSWKEFQPTKEYINFFFFKNLKIILAE